MSLKLSSPIALQSGRCLQLFDRLCSLLDDKTSTDLISQTACIDESARFCLWANNIGAFLSIDHRNSLDFRLRQVSRICNRVVEFLEDLAEALNDACSIVSGTRPNRVAVDANVSSGLRLEVSEFSEVFGTVKDSITSLMQISIIIRNATPRDRYIKAQSSTKNPFLDSFDVAHVGHKFPKIDSEGQEWLKRRLGKAITQRRQYLKYCREHHDKFSQQTELSQTTEVPRKTEVADESPKSEDPLNALDPISKIQHEVGTVRSVPVSALAPTDASTLQVSKLEATEGGDAEDISDSYSQTSYATSVHDDTTESKLHTPSLKDITTRFPFECPYCWTLQNGMNEKSWRKHVFADLRPYVCTFEECDLRLFADRHMWFNHELECHRAEWFCRFCSHPPFGSEARMKAHMGHQHGAFSSPNQIPLLIKASKQSVDHIPATACPLCDWDTALRGLNSHTPQNEKLVVTLEEFRRHLGTHMEQLALFALPRRYKDGEDNADSNEAAAMGHSDSQSRHLSRTETMSWKTVSSRGATFDKAVPDVSMSVVPNIGMQSGNVYPWSQQPLDMYNCFVKPFPIYGAAIGQVCTTEGDLCMQGGLTSGRYLEHNVSRIEIKGRSICHSIEADFPLWMRPSPRVGHAALLVGKNFIIFGGKIEYNYPTPDCDNVLYLFDTSIEHWSKLEPNTSTPYPRNGHTMNLLGTAAVVFGGTSRGVFFNDLSALNLDKLKSHPKDVSWETLMPDESQSKRPLARAGHTMVAWDEKLYLFGGTNSRLWFSDVWQYSFSTGWTEMDCTGDIPQGRDGHAAAVVDAVMYIFGGRNKKGNDLGDLAALDLGNGCWYTFQNVGTSPSPRSGHRMVVHDKQIFVLGGMPQSPEAVYGLETLPEAVSDPEAVYDPEELALMYTLDTTKLRYPPYDDEDRDAYYSNHAHRWNPVFLNQ